MARCFIINNSFIITFLFSYSNLCACVCLVCTPASTQRRRQATTISTSMHGFHDTTEKSQKTYEIVSWRTNSTRAHKHTWVYLYTIGTIVARWMETEAEREQAKYWWARVQSFSICVRARSRSRLFRLERAYMHIVSAGSRARFFRSDYAKRKHCDRLHIIQLAIIHRIHCWSAFAWPRPRAVRTNIAAI